MKTPIVLLLLWLVPGSIHAQQPAGNKEFSVLYNAIKAEPDPLKMEVMLAKMEKMQDAGQWEAELADYSRQLVATSFAEYGNIQKMNYWLERIGDSAARESALFSAAVKLTEKGHLDAATQLLLPLLKQKEVETVQMKTSNGARWKVTTDDVRYQYGIILYKKGEFMKAIPLLVTPHAAADNRRSHERAEIYAMALAAAGEKEKAFHEMERLMAAPWHKSAGFVQEARTAFIARYGNDKRFSQLSDSISTMLQKKIEQKVESMRVDMPAHDFELKDLNGKTVALKQLRGKTVILDFWATWCQPCVASFPGMQKAVDYYRNDTTVVFMFIHTFEKSANATPEARDFMAFKQYRFDVYMDLKNEKGINPVVTGYNVKGIPTKFVIDKNGNIRYRNVGFVPEDEAIAEIRTMVEAIR